MIKEHTYCDVCGKDMTSFDADGDAVITGYTIEQHRLMLDYSERTDFGSRSRAGFIPHGHFCSDECLSAGFNAMFDKAGSKLVCAPQPKENGDD